MPVTTAARAARIITPNVRLAKALAAARAGEGVHAYDVAARAGISGSWLSNIVHGHARPSREHAEAIARALGAEVNALFDAGQISEGAA